MERGTAESPVHVGKWTTTADMHPLTLELMNHVHVRDGGHGAEACIKNRYGPPCQ